MIGTPCGETFALWRAGYPGPWQDHTHHAFVEKLRMRTMNTKVSWHLLDK